MEKLREFVIGILRSELRQYGDWVGFPMENRTVPLICLALTRVKLEQLVDRALAEPRRKLCLSLRGRRFRARSDHVSLPFGWDQPPAAKKGTPSRVKIFLAIHEDRFGLQVRCLYPHQRREIGRFSREWDFVKLRIYEIPGFKSMPRKNSARQPTHVICESGVQLTPLAEAIGGQVEKFFLVDDFVAHIREKNQEILAQKLFAAFGQEISPGGEENYLVDPQVWRHLSDIVEKRTLFPP